MLVRYLQGDQIKDCEMCGSYVICHLWQRGEMHTGFWLENLKERDSWEHTGFRGEIILKWVVNK
jgi:hypothetical protein